MNWLLCLFRRCSHKNICFSELVYHSSVFVLMICTLKDVLKDLALDFGLMGLKACWFSLRFTTIDLLFLIKILACEIKSNIIL